MYAVVSSFNFDGGDIHYSVIPMSWLNKDRTKFSYPPANEKLRTIFACVKKKVKPESSWRQYTVRKIHHDYIITYERAARLEKEVMKQSSADERATQLEKGSLMPRVRAARKKNVAVTRKMSKNSLKTYSRIQNTFTGSDDSDDEMQISNSPSMSGRKASYVPSDGGEANFSPHSLHEKNQFTPVRRSAESSPFLRRSPHLHPENQESGRSCTSGRKPSHPLRRSPRLSPKNQKSGGSCTTRGSGGVQSASKQNCDGSSVRRALYSPLQTSPLVRSSPRLNPENQKSGRSCTTRGSGGVQSASKQNRDGSSVRRALYSPLRASTSSTISHDAEFRLWQDSVDNKLNTILEILQSNGPIPRSCEDVPFDGSIFPINSIKDFFEINEKLANNEAFKREVREYLSTVQNDTVKETTYTLVNRIFSDKLAICVVVGKTDGRKVCIKHSAIVKLITSVVVSHFNAYKNSRREALRPDWSRIEKFIALRLKNKTYSVSKNPNKKELVTCANMELEEWIKKNGPGDDMGEEEVEEEQVEEEQVEEDETGNNDPIIPDGENNE